MIVRRWGLGLLAAAMLAGCGQAPAPMHGKASMQAAARSAPAGKFQVRFLQIEAEGLRAGAMVHVPVEIEVLARGLELAPPDYAVLVSGHDQTGDDITVRYLDQPLAGEKQTFKGTLVLTVPKDATEVVLRTSVWHRDYPLGGFARQTFRLAR